MFLTFKKEVFLSLISAYWRSSSSVGVAGYAILPVLQTNIRLFLHSSFLFATVDIAVEMGYKQIASLSH